MTKTKVLSFFPGDDVNINIKAHFTKFTILKIEAIEINEPINDEVNIDFNE